MESSPDHGRPRPRLMRKPGTQFMEQVIANMQSVRSTSTVDLDPEELKRDVTVLHERVRRMGQGLLNPRSKFMQYWDFVTISALFYTATVTPYEVCMLWDEIQFDTLFTSGGGVLFIINWVVNLVFIVDSAPARARWPRARAPPPPDSLESGRPPAACVACSVLQLLPAI